MGRGMRMRIERIKMGRRGRMEEDPKEYLFMCINIQFIASFKSSC